MLDDVLAGVCEDASTEPRWLACDVEVCQDGDFRRSI
jgi:hypothetical protein